MLKPAVHFDKPPIVEAVVGCQFSQIDKLLLSDILRWWQESVIRSEYPTFEFAPRLAKKIEVFGGQQQTFDLTLDHPSDQRIWFVKEDKHELIQLQNDRIHFNWRIVNEVGVYPHAEYLMSEFFRILDMFSVWLKNNGFGNLDINQIEMTYIDLIDQEYQSEQNWSHMGDVFSIVDLQSLESIDSAFMKFSRDLHVFEEDMPDARLHIILQTAERQKSKEPVVKLETTVRGMPKDSEKESIVKFLEMSRQYINKAFVGITTDDVKKKWGYLSNE